MDRNIVLIKVSAKFQRQYPGLPKTHGLPECEFPLTWNLDIMSHRRSQLLILASEESSLYSLLIPVGRSRDPRSFILALEERLAQILPLKPRAVIGLIAKRSNRHVIGSQNDLLFIASAYLENADKPATASQLQRIEDRLNSTFMSYIGRERPRVAFARLVEKLGQAGKS